MPLLTPHAIANLRCFSSTDPHLIGTSKSLLRVRRRGFILPHRLKSAEISSSSSLMAIAGGITPRSGPLLFKPSTVSIPIYQMWKTNSFNIGQAMIKSVLGSKLICASLRSNDHSRLSYGGDFDNEPFWKTMVKDIAWSLKSVAVFLTEQPSQIKYIEWPTFHSTLRTAMLTLVLVAVLIVALSSVDSCLSYILALLLRRAA